MVGIREHFEGLLGRATVHSVDGRPWHLLEFTEQPMRGCSTYVTDGLRLANGTGAVRQEYLMMLRPDQAGVRDVVAAMAWMSKHADDGVYLERGSVHTAELPFFQGYSVRDIYVTFPTYLDEALHAIAGEPVTEIAWMVPILGREVTLLARRGWSDFEDELVREDPDLTDLARPPLSAALAQPDVHAGYATYGLASRPVAGGDAVLLMYRDPPDHEQDSGWRFFSRAEGIDDLRDPTFAMLVELAGISRRDARVGALLQSPVGAMFARETAQDDFVQVGNDGRPLPRRP